MEEREREEVLLLGRWWKSRKTLLLVFVQSRHLKFWCGGIKAVILWKWNKLHWVGMLVLTLMGRTWSQLYFASARCYLSFATAVFFYVFSLFSFAKYPYNTYMITFTLILFPSSEPLKMPVLLACSSPCPSLGRWPLHLLDTSSSENYAQPPYLKGDPTHSISQCRNLSFPLELLTKGVIMHVFAYFFLSRFLTWLQALQKGSTYVYLIYHHIPKALPNAWHVWDAQYLLNRRIYTTNLRSGHFHKWRNWIPKDWVLCPRVTQLVSDGAETLTQGF